jgi:hypothetical protein
LFSAAETAFRALDSSGYWCYASTQALWNTSATYKPFTGYGTPLFIIPREKWWNNREAIRQAGDVDLSGVLPNSVIPKDT